MFKKQITWTLTSILALAIVIGGGIYARDSRLRASDENVYAKSQQGDTPEEVTEGEATRVQAIIIEEESSDKNMKEESEESEEIRIERSVVVTSNMEGIEEAEAGTEVVLSTELLGFEDCEVTFLWQYSEDGASWMDIDGAEYQTYSFELDEVNAQYYWRVVVTTAG